MGHDPCGGILAHAHLDARPKPYQVAPRRHLRPTRGQAGDVVAPGSLHHRVLHLRMSCALCLRAASMWKRLPDAWN